MKELISQLPHSLGPSSVNQSGRCVSHNPQFSQILMSDDRTHIFTQ